MVASDPPQLAVELDRSGPTLTAYVEGDLDAATAGDLVSPILAGVDAGVNRVCVDMARVTFCDSTGLRALVEVHAAASKGGATVTVQDPPRQVRRVLEVTGVDQVIPVVGVGPG